MNFFIYLKTIIFEFCTILRSIYITGMNAFSKRETKLYPDYPVKLSHRFRGRIVLTRDSEGKERCVACNLCATVCPVDCIALQKAEDKNGRWYPKFFRINFSRCIFCGFCEEACPTSAIQLIQDFEMSEFDRKNLVYEKNELLISRQGKYKNYNFYNETGKSFKNKKNKFIDVKQLVP